MSNGYWFTIMYVKNLFLLCVMVALVLSLFDATRGELEMMVTSYESLSDSMQVIFTTGLATLPLIFTWAESKLADSLYKRGTDG